ncbi:tail fiber assembly protein, partial [Escherichia coli]
MYVWSAKANGFFPISEKEKFEASGLWPDDGVIVSEEEHKKLFMDIPPGKQIGTLNGKPALIDIPQPTKKELIAIAEVKKSQLREKADSEISWRQDAVDADIATDEETSTLTEWK